MTKYEKEIYNLISISAEHMTVEQVFRKVKEKYPKVVQATIYNNINKLWAAGLIRKVSTEGMADRYDRVNKHDHLVCRQCGRLVDVAFDDLTASLQKAIEEEGGQFLYYDLKIYYLCPSCRKQRKKDL